jgi:adenylosuccinate lyase
MTVIIRTQSAHGRMSADEAVRKKSMRRGKKKKQGKKEEKIPKTKTTAKRISETLEEHSETHGH